MARPFHVGASRGRLILVAVLGVVLISVSVYQFAGSKSPSPEKKAKTGARRRGPGRAANIPAAAKPSKDPDSDAQNDEAQALADVRQKEWPAMHVGVVATHDPFGRPPWARRRVAEKPAVRTASLPQSVNQLAQRQQEMLDELNKQGVRLILRDKSGSVAVIGERRLREGDLIDDLGLRVTRIDEQGVTLEVEHPEH